MAASCLLVLAASSPPRQTLLSTSLDTLSTSLDTPQWTSLEEIAPTLESHGRNVSAPTLAAPTSNGDVEEDPVDSCTSQDLSHDLFDRLAAMNVSASRLTSTDPASRGLSITALTIIYGSSVLLLCFGALLVNAATIAMSLIGTFLVSLGLLARAMHDSPDHFIRCTFALSLAALLAIVAAFLAGLFVRSLVELSLFVSGASGGAFSMLLLRDILLAASPSLISEPVFIHGYWPASALIALLCGLLAAYLSEHAVLLVTSVVGGYGFALSLIDLIPAFGGPVVPGFVFFLLFFTATLAGVLLQTCTKRLMHDGQGQCCPPAAGAPSASALKKSSSSSKKKEGKGKDPWHPDVWQGTRGFYKSSSKLVKRLSDLAAMPRSVDALDLAGAPSDREREAAGLPRAGRSEGAPSEAAPQEEDLGEHSRLSHRAMSRAEFDMRV